MCHIFKSQKSGKSDYGDCSLDEKTRGFIEKALDEYEEKVFHEDFAWITELVPISTLKDYILGYIIGRMLSVAFAVYFAATKILLIFPKKITDEDRITIGLIVGRRALEVYDKIEQMLHQ